MKKTRRIKLLGFSQLFTVLLVPQGVWSQEVHEHTFTASSNGFCTSCSTGYQQPEVEESDEAPYLIANAGQLYWFAEHVNNAYLDSKIKIKY